MNTFFRKAFLLAAVLSLSSCAHQFMRGTVAQKLSSSKVIICLGEDHVEVGDRIKFLKSECSWSNTSNITMHELSGQTGGFDDAGYGQAQCELVSIGHGKVTKLINNHYSEVETDEDFSISKGILIQKVK